MYSLQGGDQKTKLPIAFPYGWCYERPALNRQQFERNKPAFQVHVENIHEQRRELFSALEHWEASSVADHNELEAYRQVGVHQPDARLHESISKAQAKMKTLQERLRKIKVPDWARDWTMNSSVPDVCHERLRSVIDICSDSSIESVGDNDGDDPSFNPDDGDTTDDDDEVAVVNDGPSE